MTSNIRSQRGLSLTEVTIMLSVLSVLTAVMSPTIGDYVNDARHVKAASDVQVLATTFARFAYDVPADRNLASGWATYDLLVGPGDAPTTEGTGNNGWTAAEGTKSVGDLNDHLMVNTPGYPTRQPGPHYVAGGWRGAYLSELTADPWGHRYAINVRAMSGAGQADTMVLSAGPNGIVETAFDADGLNPGGDDIVAVISGGSR
jgi:type II secretory pathway pseudopilin PulG